MCLILVAWRCHGQFPLVVAANRDEFFTRPTAVAGFWADAPEVLGGRDLQAGGSWMGITRRGRFAALTNFRAPESHREAARSRGRLVEGFLRGHQSVPDYLASLAPEAHEYNGFDLLVAEGETLAWYSNVGGEPRYLEPGIYGVSNHLLDTPWPKVAAAKSALAGALSALPDDGALFKLLRDDTVYPDDVLPRTGVSLDWERLLSAAFVNSPGYGTRSSTVLLSAADGTTVFDEQTWREDGSPDTRVRYRYSTISTGV